MKVIQSEIHPDISYRLDKKLGEGGTAAAYLAERVSPFGKSPAVVKIVLPQLAAASDQTALMVMRKEAVALGRLNERIPPSPFVVRLLDAGVVGTTEFGAAMSLPWLAIEYVHGGVEGTTLEERVEHALENTGYGFDPERATRLIAHVCDGLEEVHAANVIHRDLTPRNVLCCGFAQDEIFKISDFGLARPIGVQATFGEKIIGTPGYMAPEQVFQDLGPLGPHSDAFSMAACIYFALTGERYMDAKNAVQMLMAVRSAHRKSLLDAPRLSPELRQRPEACRGIDQVLARATRAEIAPRTPSARILAANLLPWLSSPTSSQQTSRRRIDTLNRIRVAASTETWSWTVRHPPGGERVVASVGWDADAHALVSTTDGLAYWDGTNFSPAPDRDLPNPRGVRCVRRFDAGHWLIGSDGATVAEYARAGLLRVLRGPDPSFSFIDASGALDDLLVLVARRDGAPPIVLASSRARWVRPIPVEHAAFITSVAPVDADRWLVVGRRTDGQGYAALYSPLMFELSPLAASGPGPLLAVAGRPERELTLAVGANGAILRLERGRVQQQVVEGRPNFAAAAVDVLGREWAAGVGELWMSPGAGAPFCCVWHDSSWRAPFVSLFADAGMVVGMTADGGVIESHASASQILTMRG